MSVARAAPARQLFRDEPPQPLGRAAGSSSPSRRNDERLKLVSRQPHAACGARGRAAPAPARRTRGASQIRGEPGRAERRRAGHRVQVVADGVLQADERPVVHECRLQRHVAQRRRAERVAVGRLPASPARDRSPRSPPGRRTDVVDDGGDLRHADDVLRKSLNISFDGPPRRGTARSRAAPKNSTAPRFSSPVSAFAVAARITGRSARRRTSA